MTFRSLFVLFGLLVTLWVVSLVDGHRPAARVPAGAIALHAGGTVHAPTHPRPRFKPEWRDTEPSLDRLLAELNHEDRG